MPQCVSIVKAAVGLPNYELNQEELKALFVAVIFATKYLF